MTTGFVEYFSSSLITEANLKDEVQTLTTSDGETLFFRKIWDPTVSPRGLITHVHGLGEHNQRFDHVFVRFAKSGFIIHTFDQRGHGRSTGPRGHSPSYDTVMEDLSLIFNKSEDDSLPHYLYGHSLGGGEVLRFPFHLSATGNQRRLDGVIASAPFLRTGTPVPFLKKFFGQLLAPLLPWVILDNELDLNGLAQNPSIKENYVKDSLVHSKISLGLANGGLNNGEFLIASAKDFTLPVYIFHGDADVLTSHAASKLFFDSVGSKDKTYRSWQGGFHELHNDNEKEEVLQEILDWLLARISSSSSSSSSPSSSSSSPTQSSL